MRNDLTVLVRKSETVAVTETRKLAAILAADVVGFSRLTGMDEDRALARMRALRSDVIDPTIAVHHGQVVKRTGDGALVEFRSVVDAVRCAIEVQNSMIERNAGLPPERRIEFRIGIHLGDVVEESDGDLMGDGVNIAARLEVVAKPGAICLSEDAYQQVKARLDLAVNDLGPTALKNIAEPVRVYSIAVGPAAAQKSGPGAAPDAKPSAQLVAPQTPSIAVLPFQNMSDDPSQEYFADGLAEDIITTLSKLVGLRVVARNSSFVYKGRSVDVREPAISLDVRFILEGSVRKAADCLRVTAQLIDAEDGSHLWAERYDRPVKDIFAIQDEITLAIATELQVQLTEGEQARLRYTTTDNVQAWTYWAQGRAYARQAISKDNIGRGLELWRKALARDPNSAPLNAAVGLAHSADARLGWWEPREEALRKSYAYARRALEIDPDNSDAHIAMSYNAMIEGRFEEAVKHARRAVDVAPGSADAATMACFVLASAGHASEAVPLIEKAMKLSPLYPPNYLGHLGNVYRLTGRFEEAIAAFKAYDARAAGFGLTDLVIAYQQTDRPRFGEAGRGTPPGSQTDLHCGQLAQDAVPQRQNSIGVRGRRVTRRRPSRLLSAIYSVPRRVPTKRAHRTRQAFW
jgi:adenylate cyclase